MKECCRVSVRVEPWFSPQEPVSGGRRSCSSPDEQVYSLALAEGRQNVVDQPSGRGEDRAVPEVSDRSAVLTEVERFHGHFMYLNEELSLIVELLGLEGEGRKRISDLCREAKVDLRMKAIDLESFREKYRPDSSTVDGEALVLAATCAPLIAMEIAALGLFAEALTVAERIEDDDLEFVDGVLRTARSVYNAHVSFVHSALILQGEDLVAFAESCDTDPGTAASRDAFNALLHAEFPQFKAKVMERSSD